jgi:hypothetical protein
MWHQFWHNYKTMPNKKIIFNFFYYTQTLINIWIIFLHNISKEKKMI